MSQINNIASTDAAQQIVSNPLQRSAPPATTDTLSPPREPDQVELSGVDQYVQALQTNNIRTDLVASVRSQIDAGTYEDENKLNVAADGLLDDLTK
jgi:anti-sigma28 factor (negative regulator of flagellin synthesis)